MNLVVVKMLTVDERKALDKLCCHCCYCCKIHRQITKFSVAQVYAQGILYRL